MSKIGHQLAIVIIPLFSLVLCARAIPEALPVVVKATDIRLHYNGRVDRRSPAGPRLTFPGSELTVRFQGTAFNARLSTTIADCIQVVVDGRPTEVLALTKEPMLYTVARDLAPGDHTVKLFKRTEAVHGTMQIHELQFSADAAVLAARPASRNIEFIGDSITCGYGNEAVNQAERFAPTNSNHYLSYAAIAARALNAEHVAVAVSGICLTDGPGRESMPLIYRRGHPSDHEWLWDFTLGATPDVIVINLGTNDFSLIEPDEKNWVKSFNSFLDFIRAQRPAACIFLTTGPMMGPGPKLDHLCAWNREVLAQRQAAGDKNIYVLDFPVQQAEDGYGSDWHPSVRTHERMAAQLVAAIKAVTGR